MEVRANTPAAGENRKTHWKFRTRLPPVSAVCDGRVVGAPAAAFLLPLPRSLYKAAGAGVTVTVP